LDISNDKINKNQDDNLKDLNEFNSGLDISNDKINKNQDETHHSGKL